MKHLYFLTVFFCFTLGINAQIQFEQVLPLPPAPQIIAEFDRVSNSSIAFADIDGDNDPDVLITGKKASGQPISKLYTNDGNGGFTEVTGTPFDGVKYGSIAFADIDGDNDPDVLITGEISGGQLSAKLYTNDGSGGYTEVTGTPFDGVSNSSIAFADIDGDNDQDVLITGFRGDHIAKLYTNDGSGGFTEVTGTPFDGVDIGSIAFADIDGDNDPDVLITGEKTSGQPISKLYTNDGSGSFTEVLVSQFDWVRFSSIAFTDIDGDNDPDVLITGEKLGGQRIAKLYTNDGSGSFTEVTGTPFDEVIAGSIVFADIDGDNDPDVLITGFNSSNQYIAKLYTNDGSGGFTEVTGTPFDGVWWSSIAFADIDGDNDLDVLITGGISSSGGAIAKLYTNDGSGGYTEGTGNSFVGVEFSSIAFADIDGDNDPDVLITGESSGGQPITKLYTNDGSGGYTEVTGTPFDGVEFSSIAFADIDGDNDPDVLITGENSVGQPIAKLYTNNGSGGYTEVIGTSFDGVRRSSIAFADIDGDNDQDVLITGENSSDQAITKLYTNDGSGVYTEVTGTPFDGVIFSSIAFADIDGDNDPDVLITGDQGSFQWIAKLYTNDGSGGYTEVTGTPFDGVRNSSIAFADIDGDNDQDVLITGQKISDRIAKLYTNDGSGGYTEVTGTPFDGAGFSSIALADIDGDNDPDVLITGFNYSAQHIAKLYTNDGSGGFTEVTGTPFDGVWLSSIAFADIDGDNDPDVLITGENSSGRNISKLYANDGSGGYTEITGNSFVGVAYSSIAFADIDGDNDPDVLITGENSSNQPIAKLYTNDGSGGYTEVTGTPFDGVSRSSIAFADIDSDNDPDVLITGLNSSNQRIAKLYTNNGSGGYTEATGTPFEGVHRSSIAFADIDGDNDPDVLITGEYSHNQSSAKLYTNDSSGGYTEVTGTSFDGVSSGSIAFADIDGDNDPDVLITGRNTSLQRIAKLYTNDGNGGYTEDTGTPFDGVSSGSIAFADIDGDNDLDVMITGRNTSLQRIAKLYTNDGNGGYTEDTGTPFDGVSSGSIAFADIDGDNDLDVMITGYVNPGFVITGSSRIAKLYTNNGSGGYTEVTGTPLDGVDNGSIAFTDIDGDNDPDMLITGRNSGNQRIAKLSRNTSFELSWTGNINNLWSESDNWSTNTLPISTSKVFITNVSNQPIIETADQIEINNLNLRTNTSLDVSGVLKVNQNITNNGQITFKSDETSSGQFDAFTGTISGAGQITVERYIPAKRAFRLLASPVTTTDFIYENWQESGSTPATPDGLGTHITGGAASLGFDQSGSNSPSMFTFDNGFVPTGSESQSDAWTALPNTNSKKLKAGEAYLTFVRGDRSIDLTINSATPTNTTLKATGALQTGSLTLSSANNLSTPEFGLSDQADFYSLVGNPYQAIVDINNLDFTNVKSNFYWVWDPNLGSQGQYTTVSLPSGLNNTTSSANQFVQPGQSFFVQTIADGASSLTYNEDDKNTSGGATTIFSDQNKPSIQLLLYTTIAFSSGAKESDGTLINFNENANNGLDLFDADKFLGPGENLARLHGNELISIENRAMPTDNEVLALSTTGYAEDNYTFVVNASNIQSNFETYLLDNYTGSQTLLNEGATQINFSVDANIPESIAADRFNLVFDNTTLGINENSFGADFSLYPNPTKDGYFSIRTPNLSGEVTINLNNMLGQIIMNENLTIVGNEVNIKAKGLSTGVYIVKLTQDEQTFSTKLIVE